MPYTIALPSGPFPLSVLLVGAPARAYTTTYCRHCRRRLPTQVVGAPWSLQICFAATAVNVYCMPDDPEEAAIMEGAIERHNKAYDRRHALP